MAHRRTRPAGKCLLAAIFLLCGCADSRAAAPAGGQDAGPRPQPPPPPQRAAYADPSSLDPAVPAPEIVLDHPGGERAVRYERLVEYLKRLDAASPLLTMTPYATSHEGRILYYVTITSERNHARLAEIKAANAALADPRRLASEAEARATIDSAPAVAWLAYAIHGDELSPADAAMEVCYLLCAGRDDRLRRLREELVIHVDPLQNPDGRERYLAQLETLRGKVENPDYQAMQHAGLWSAGRGNHYLFDLNRDWLMFVHPETRGRSAVIREWNPQLLVDSHEMSGLDTYLFDPPREPLNVSLAESTLRWRMAFSADQARAFDARGWSYYTREWYEEWYPGYTNAWASLLGTIGLLYEAPGLNAASVRQASGELMRYRDAVDRNITGTLANLETLRQNRREVLRDWHADRRWAVSGEAPLNETFLLPPGPDGSRRDLFLEVLAHQGIEYAVSEGALKAQGVSTMRGEKLDEAVYPAGTVQVRPAQPHRRLMHAVLGFDPRMSDAFLLEERTELERRRGSRLYDTTAWNLPMAFGLETACWAERVERAADAAAPAAPAAHAGAAGAAAAEATYGYVIDGLDSSVHEALVRLFDRGCWPRVASKPFTAGGRQYVPGAILLRRHENPADLDAIVRDVQRTTENLDVRSAGTALAEDGPDLGGQRFHLLHAPRVAIASQWPIATTSFGAVWHLLDVRLGMRCSPVNVQQLSAIDLRPYNVIVLPDSWDGGALAAVLDGGALEALKTWVGAGGTLIALGESAASLARKDGGLSQVRQRQDVLEELDVYAETVRRERAALDVKVDGAELWGETPPPPPPPAAAPGVPAATAADAGATAPTDTKSRERLDEWQRLFAPQGVFIQARADTEHWLAFGAHDFLPVLYGGSSAFMSKPPIETAVRFGDADHLRLSGLLWPEARGRLADTAYATREGHGRGQIILFAADPFMRGYLEGTGRLLRNAILLGPGMGTEQPIPW